MDMMVEGQLTQSQLSQILIARRTAKEMRGIIGTRFGAGVNADAYKLPTHGKSAEPRVVLVSACAASAAYEQVRVTNKLTNKFAYASRPGATCKLS